MVDTAQHLVAQTIGILVLAWVLGYTLIRGHEAGLFSKEEHKPQAEAPDAPRRGSVAYAAQRWRGGNLSAPLWAALAGAASTVGWGRRKLEDFRNRGHEERDRGENGGGGERGEDRRRRRRWGGGDRSNRGHDSSGDGEQREGRRERGHDGGDTDPQSDQQPRNDQPDDTRGGSRDLFDHEVEVIGTRPTTPPPPSLDRPIHVLTAASPSADAAPDMSVAVLARPGEDTPEERNPSMSTGQHVAIPGAVAPATRHAGTIAPAGDTHQDAMAFSRKIEQAAGMTADTAERAEAQIVASLRAAWAAVDALAAAGVAGRVMDGWAAAVIELEGARRIATQLTEKTASASDAVAAAKRGQGRTGDAIEQVVTAAGKSAANSTRYYGKH